VRWKRADDAGVRGRKLPKRVRVEGLEVEAESGSGDSEAEGLDMVHG